MPTRRTRPDRSLQAGSRPAARREPHEARFIQILQRVAPQRELGQELSIPRKSRRMDLLHVYDEAPGLFGTLQPILSNRIVLFEHESAPVNAAKLASAMMGLTWLHWQWLEARTTRDDTGVPDPFRSTPRAPALVVVADRIRTGATDPFPHLRPTQRRGLWQCTSGDESAHAIVIDTSALSSAPGLRFWKWLGRAASAAEGAERLNRLLGDTTLPIFDRARLTEDIMEQHIPTTAQETETVYQRIVRESQERGEKRGEKRGERRGERRGEKRGEKRGRRKALLDLVREVKPEAAASLESIRDPGELAEAVKRLLGPPRDDE